MLELSFMDKKNKQQMNKLNSIINQYESKLDSRVDNLLQQILNYTKKCSDPVVLPAISNKKHNQSNKKQALKQRTKSLSYNTQISFQNQSFDQQMQQLRQTFKHLQTSKGVPEGGRSAGNQPFIRPKFIKKKPQILPKEIRLNPLHERNAIKAHQLDKGLLYLLEKGKIGKDVNIITAFEKGRPVLQTNKAIFHQGEERFAQLDLGKEDLKASRHKNQSIKKQHNMDFMQKNTEQNNWAITMPKDDEKGNSNTMFTKTEQKSKMQMVYKQHIYLKLINYEAVRDQKYKQFIVRNINYKGQIIQILQQITKLMYNYSIDIAYADSAVILENVTKINKLSKQELIRCLVNKNNDLATLKTVRNIDRKKILAIDRVVSCFRYFMERKAFLKYLKQKKIANRIYGWAVSCWTVKKRIEDVKHKRKYIQQSHIEMQRDFAQRYSKLTEERHYEIHIINQNIQGKQAYKQYMNIQITRIFNLRNPNKYLLYLLPQPLDEQTLNYYYKIMELEEIPNYKERVSFIEVDPHGIFTHKINLSTKLYYSSKTIRRLKKKIKEFPAYFIISYPTYVDIQLSTYLKIPILGGNLIRLLQIQKRASLQAFNFDMLEHHVIEKHSTHNLTVISNQLIAYCQSLKRHRQFIIKINGINRSKGAALLTFPFSSLPEMYTCTNVVCQGITVDQFYHLLLKQGGVIQTYQEQVYPIVAILNITINGQVNLIGTFEKLSSGFINIGYTFPQRRIENKWILDACNKVGGKLFEEGHFGDAEVTFYVDANKSLYLQKVQCYLTHLGSSLFYYRFLSEGQFNLSGDYMAKIIDTFEKQEGIEEQVITMEPRSFCYIPYILHFGLSDRQINSFFQLCRMGGVSFDLENKYGATFILLGSLKTSMGLITTAKDRKGALKLMLKSLEFIVKQNSHNMSQQTLLDKEMRMKQRENILNIKQRLQDV